MSLLMNWCTECIGIVEDIIIAESVTPRNVSGLHGAGHCVIYII